MDINRLQARYTQLHTDLQNAIASNNQRLVTLYRGRLIRTISRMVSSRYASQLPAGRVATLNSELQNLLFQHREQLNNRIAGEKRNGRQYSISNEIALKIRRMANSAREIKHAPTAAEKAGAAFNTIGNGLSTLFSVSKYAIRPAGFVVQRAAGVASYLAGYAVALPVNVMAQLLGKIVNPDRPWSLEASRRFGGTLREVTEEAIGRINEGIIRL